MAKIRRCSERSIPCSEWLEVTFGKAVYKGRRAVKTVPLPAEEVTDSVPL
jgi:hypothetical protein